MRVWTPAEPEGTGPELRGKVTHVGTGAAGAFADGEELLAFIRDRRGSVPVEGARATEGRT